MQANRIELARPGLSVLNNATPEPGLTLQKIGKRLDKSRLAQPGLSILVVKMNFNRGKEEVMRLIRGNKKAV